MKIKHFAWVLLLSPGAFAQNSGVPELQVQSVPNFLKLPADMNLGEASGVALNSKRHMFIYTRGNSTGPAYGATASQLLEFGPDGKFLREIGKGLYAWSFAHTVHIDRDDNIWVIDKGSDMIIKFNPEGHVMMVFGRKKEASDDGSEPWKHPNPPLPAVDGMFRQPTDVAWDAQGNIYISDGYINSRVAKYDKNGDWIKQWGTFGKGKSQFNTPHSIATDAQGNVYVADRGNRRIQVFDGDGTYLREITIDAPVPADARPAIGNPINPAAAMSAPNLSMAPGAPDAICITPGATQYIYAADLFPGRLYKLTLDGKLLGMSGRSGKQLGQFGWVHQLACVSENEVYAAELLNWRVQKLIIK
jgi:hypothetical protein